MSAPRKNFGFHGITILIQITTRQISEWALFFFKANLIRCPLSNDNEFGFVSRIRYLEVEVEIFFKKNLVQRNRLEYRHLVSVSRIHEHS